MDPRTVASSVETAPLTEAGETTCRQEVIKQVWILVAIVSALTGFGGRAVDHMCASNASYQTRLFYTDQ